METVKKKKILTNASVWMLCLFINLLPYVKVKAQCNTALNKLLPETSINNDDRFGSHIAANGQYMVVAAENSDTLGILYGGAAFVYEKTVAGWAYRAMLTPSDPDEYDFFGNEVAIDASGNTIVVINRNYDKGGAYIFEKPVSGWETMQETANIKFPQYLEFNSALDISDDGTTIIVSNPMSNNGLLYLLTKPVGGWTNTTTPQTLVSRINNSGVWLGSDVLIHDNYLYASSNNETNSGIYVYKWNGSTYEQIAKLSATISISFLTHFGIHLTINGNTIAATGLSYQPGSSGQKFFLFQKNGEWTDMNETIQLDLPGPVPYNYQWLPIQFISPTTITTTLLLQEGPGYTGKVVEMTTTDGSWQDLTLTTLYEDKQLSVPTEFSNGLAWNGSDLITATVRKHIGFAYRNSILSLSQSAGIWGSLQQVTLPRNSSSNVNFGTSIIKTKEAMFAGAPYDGTVGRGAGAVYVYHKSGTEFTKVSTIYPSPRKIRSTGGSDAAFGYSLSVYQDEIAIGAPSFLYASSPSRYGKIFMYRRTNNDWTTTSLYDSLIVPAELNLNHVGTAIAMNDHVLFASAYNNFNDEHTNALVIFEKVDSKWGFKQLIKFGKPIDRSWPSVKLSLNGDQLAVGEFFTVNGGVSIINKDPGDGNWKIKAFISGDIFSGLGGAVKLMDNHLFVGAPGLNHNNVYRSGAVAVFTKLPGESWASNAEPSAIIGAQQPIEGAFFGSSLDVVANTLVVGAPGMFLTFDSQVRTIPGNSYVIQAQDYYWKNTVQYLNLQGDRYAHEERDHFGSYVTLDEDYFYIGARSENTLTGKFSGAVYYIPTPPVIFLQPPVCQNAEPFTLKAYPFNGTWAGHGVDAAGAFSPSLTGPGTFTITYSTPNCNYQGTVQVEVKPPIVVQRLSPEDITKCSENNTTLKLESISGASYNWYYRPEGSNAFIWLANGGASFVATNPGEYKAIVSSLCSAESPIFRIRLENFTISVGPQDVVCSNNENVSLIASNNSGVWQGTGVSGNRFNSAGLANGTYNLTYQITSPIGCLVTLLDSIKINTVTPLVINEVSNNFCITGATTLRAAPVDNNLSYTWYYKELSNQTLQPINQVLSDQATVYEQGYYQVIATNGECSNNSNTLQIGFDNDLSYSLSPVGNSQHTLCNETEFAITAQAQEGTQYIWQYKPTSSDNFQVIPGNISNQLLASESGSYKVIGVYGFCSFESLPVTVEFLSDQVFVPNVFTPNGDDKNPRLEIQTTRNIKQFMVFNRYGSEIYRNINGTWDGGESPTGIYYWYLKYEGCDEEKELKGWVHLIR